jgi:hypothetical protein
MGLAYVCQQRVSKASQAILVSQDNVGNFSCTDRIDQLQKLLALKGETASYLGDPRINDHPLLLTVCVKHGLLLQQIRLLCLARYPAIGHGASILLHTRQSQRNCQIFIRVGAPMGDRPTGGQHADAIPFLDGLDGDADFLRELGWCLQSSIVTFVRVENQELAITSL